LQTGDGPASTGFLIRSGRFFFKYRDLLFPLVFLPLALATRPREPFGEPGADRALLWSGLLAVVAGQTLRALVIGLAYIRRGGKDKQIYAEGLVQQGIFAHSRNPLYLGNLLIVAGLAMIHGGPWMYLGALPFFVFVYVSIVAAEESYLHDRFGARYAEYCRQVPRFGLRMRGLWATIRGMDFAWKRLVLKEYGTLFSTVTAVLVLLAWRLTALEGFDAARGEFKLLAGIWLVTALAYSAARYLKKSRTWVDRSVPAGQESKP
jgi:protein-S-isoprenylcysteine O-methyltransferase Ste14